MIDPQAMEDLVEALNSNTSSNEQLTETIEQQVDRVERLLDSFIDKTDTLGGDMADLASEISRLSQSIRDMGENGI